MTNNLHKPRPPGWTESSLFSFIEDCWSNSIATVGNSGIPCQRLTEIDRVFEAIQKHKLNPQTHSKLVPCLLFVKAFVAFRASVMVCTALPTEGYVLHRSCLEYAGYAALIGSDSTTALAECWFRRDDSKETKQKVRDAFTQARVRNAIAAYDANLAEAYQRLYERCIDWGAHPNEKSITPSLVKETVSRESKTLLMTMLSGHGPAIPAAIKNAAQVGLCALRIFAVVIPSAFDDDTRKAIQELRSGL